MGLDKKNSMKPAEQFGPPSKGKNESEGHRKNQSDARGTSSKRQQDSRFVQMEKQSQEARKPSKDIDSERHPEEQVDHSNQYKKTDEKRFGTRAERT
jgi:hypothetical protein